MNNHLKKIMNKAWLDWHGDIPAEDIPFPESCNPSFRVGFESACEVLLPMLKQALVTVESQAREIDWILKSFEGPPENECGVLAEKIKAVIEEDE